MLQTEKLMNPDSPRVIKVLLIQGMHTDPKELTAKHVLNPILLQLEG